MQYVARRCRVLLTSSSSNRPQVRAIHWSRDWITKLVLFADRRTSLRRDGGCPRGLRATVVGGPPDVYGIKQLYACEPASAPGAFVLRSEAVGNWFGKAARADAEQH